MQLVRAIVEGTSSHVIVDDIPGGASQAELREALRQLPSVAAVTLLPPLQAGVQAAAPENGKQHQQAPQRALLQLASSSAVDCAIEQINAMQLGGAALRAKPAMAVADAQAALQALIDEHEKRLQHGSAQNGHAEVCTLTALLAFDQAN